MRWAMVRVVLLVALLASASDASAAVPRAHTSGSSLVADSGFRPAGNGYSFANYVNSSAHPNLDSGALQQLFGDAVCAGFNGGVCVLSPPALAWMQQQNSAMANGHCFGFSVTALLFWSGLSNPSQFGAGTVPKLKLAGNDSLSREIAYGYVFQLLPSVISAEVSSSPRDVLAALTSGLNRNGPLYTLGIVDQFGDGHAITPYAVRRVAPNKTEILVYDNNAPGKVRMVTVNPVANTWTYKAAVNPGSPQTVFSGNASTHTLLLFPTRPGLGVQPCPFCSPAGAPGSVPASMPAGLPATTASAARVHRASGGGGLEAVRLTAPGSVLAHLLITNRRGQHIGFARVEGSGGRLVDQIPGARIARVFAGGPRERVEPEYLLPTGQSYRIELTEGDVDGDLDGDGAPTSRISHAMTRESVTVLEPGFVAAARDVLIGRGQHATLTLSADGHTLSFVRARGGREPMLVIGNAGPGGNDYQWNLGGSAGSAGRPSTVSLDPANHRMRLGAGTYDLSMDLVHNTVAVFTHDRFKLPKGSAAVLAYGNWKSGEPMPVTVYRHGRVISSGELCDQQSIETGGQVTPTEAVYPPAHAGPCAPSAQASPSSVAFGNIAFGTQNLATTSAPQTVTLTNTGTVQLHVSSVSIGGANPGDFAVTRDRCSRQNVAPGSSCTVQVMFDPSQIGGRSASLAFADNAPGSPQIVPLFGVGIGVPGASVGSPSVSFGSEETGRTSDPQTVTLSSTGTAPLEVSGVSIAGANPSDFITRHDGCSGETLSPGQSCTLQVVFAPSQTGGRSATLSFADNAPGPPQTVSLSGTGTGTQCDDSDLSSARLGALGDDC